MAFAIPPVKKISAAAATPAITRLSPLIPYDFIIVSSINLNLARPWRTATRLVLPDGAWFYSTFL